MKKGLSLSVRINLLTIIVLVLAEGSFGYGAYISYKAEGIKLFQEKALAIAVACRPHIQAAPIQRYQQSGLASLEYLEANMLLGQIKAETDALFIYVVTEVKDQETLKYKYIFDAPTPGDHMGESSRLGEFAEADAFRDVSVVMKTRKTYVTDIYYESQNGAKGLPGNVLTAMTPIIARDGTIVGLLAVDLSAEPLLTQLDAYRRQLCANLLLIDLCCFLAVWFVFRRIVTIPISILTENLLQMADGNVEMPIKAQYLKRTDEIGVAARSFKSMQDTVRAMLGETEVLAVATASGNFSIRGDAECFKGSFKEIILKLNQSLDSTVREIHWYESAMHSINPALGIYDADMNVMFMNKTMLNQSFQKKECVYANPCSQNRFPICGTPNCAVKRFLEGVSTTQMEMDGKNYDLTVSAVHNEEGEVTAYIEIMRDVTQRIEIEKFQDIEIKKLSENLKRLAKGQLDLDLSVAKSNKYTADTRQKFLLISDTIQTAIHSIKTYVQDASSKLAAIASGDFDQEIKLDYRGDFSLIKDSLNMIIDNMNQIVRDIGVTADEVEAGAQRVAEESEKIAQATTQEDATIQEIGCAVGRIVVQADANAVNARRAQNFTKQAQNVTCRGSEKIKEMMGGMQEISAASENISKIIKTIEDIAFQTNILALNAAVEAARAGRYGKGFAVVAAEVRNLAAKSAKAASETSRLIQETIQKTTHGAEMAVDSEKTFEEIRAVVEGVGAAVDQIAEASSEQAVFISQISQAVEQISATTHLNSSAAEKSAETGLAMSARSTVLKEQIKRFKVKN